MKKLLAMLLLAITVMACKNEVKNEVTEVQEKEVEFNQELADELARMVEVDQVAANIPQGKYKEMSQQEWKAFKDSVFTTHQLRLEEIFDEHGFVGFDLAGREGSQNFWLMVQHSDHKPEFQKEVLKKMKIEVDKDNAIPSNYGLLLDRVKINSGEKQVYGTQVTYNHNTGQAYPKPLADSVTVNERRKEIGLEPLEVYLNGMTQLHFQWNKEMLQKKGITEPKLYETESR
ncbi:hypothetical protein E0K83_02905 [Gramella sp. BOM4]|nr:hypothetical protein [Christiangramia bathymodioli]